MDNSKKDNVAASEDQIGGFTRRKKRGEARSVGGRRVSSEATGGVSRPVDAGEGLDPDLERIVFEDPGIVGVASGISVDVLLDEEAREPLRVELVDPVFHGVEPVTVNSVVSSVPMSASVSVYEVRLPPVVFAGPARVRVAEGLRLEVAIPRSRGGFKARLVSPVFMEPGPGIVLSELMVAGVSEKIHARQSRSEASFGGLSGGRTGGGSLGGIASDSEVAGLAGDFFDMELIEEGVEGERSRLSFAGLLAFERPVIVLAPESAVRNYEALLLSLLREVYRMASRGLPRPLVVSEFRNVYQRADEIYATESVGFLDFRREWKEAGLDQLRDKIAELFSQGFGFLVVSYRAGDEGRVMKMLHRVSRELSRTGKEGLVSHSIPAHVVRVSPRIPLRIGKFWGQIVEPERGSPGGSINIRSSTAEKRYYYAVARIAGSVVSQLEVPVSPEGETLVHYALKSVAYLYLKYVLGYEAQAESGCGAEEARVDVCSEDVIVEVETLYGRGLPLRRLVELVESRKGLVGAGRELWIIIPPPQAGILPRGWLRRFKEYVKESYPGRVRVATVDVEHSIKLVAAIEKGEGGPGRMGEGVRPIVELAV